MSTPKLAKAIHPHTLEFKVKNVMGLCCVYGWCMMFQQKPVRGHKRMSASAMASRMGVSMETIFRTRRAFDNEKLVCEGRECCQRHLFDKSERTTLIVSYPATFRLTAGDDNNDRVLITFRDFAEIREYTPPSIDPKIAAQLALEDAILKRMAVMRVVPFPSQPWLGDRMVDTPARLSDRLHDYKKFFLKKGVE